METKTHDSESWILSDLTTHNTERLFPESEEISTRNKTAIIQSNSNRN